MKNKIAAAITVFALLLAAAHMAFPSVTVDAATLTLIAIAFIPWLAPMIKSLELPGGTKIELRDFQQLEERARGVGLMPASPIAALRGLNAAANGVAPRKAFRPLAESTAGATAPDAEIPAYAKPDATTGPLLKTYGEPAEAEYSFQTIADSDPQLAMAGLRIEIEKKLKNMAERAGALSYRQSIKSLLDILSSRQLLSEPERGVLLDLVRILNKAVHSETPIDYETALRALDIGSQILKVLGARGS